MSKTLVELLCEKESYDAIVATLGPCYEAYFPMEVRFNLATWLEAKLRYKIVTSYNTFCADSSPILNYQKNYF